MEVHQLPEPVLLLATVGMVDKVQAVQDKALGAPLESVRQLELLVEAGAGLLRLITPLQLGQMAVAIPLGTLPMALAEEVGAALEVLYRLSALAAMGALTALEVEAARITRVQIVLEAAVARALSA